MKKILRGVCLIGLIALVATSCKKKEDAIVLQSTNEQMEVVAGEFDNGEKVQLNMDDNRLYFETGDLLTLFKINVDPTLSACADFIPANTQVDQTTWTPVDPNTHLPDAGDLYAFCPGGVNYVHQHLTNGNRATFTLPVVQHYRENTCPKEGFYMASKLQEGQTSFYFRNICGLLWLKVYSPNNRKVTEIQVTDRAGHNLSGDVTLIINEVDPDELTWLYRNYDLNNTSYMQRLNEYVRRSGYSVENAGGLKLVCDEPVQVGTSSSTATNFFLTLRPLAFRQGFNIKVVCEGGYEFTQSTTRNNIIGPNVIKKMPAFNIR